METKTPSMYRRLGGATLSQLALSGEPEFPMAEIQMGQYNCLKNIAFHNCCNGQQETPTAIVVTVTCVGESDLTEHVSTLSKTLNPFSTNVLFKSGREVISVYFRPPPSPLLSLSLSLLRPSFTSPWHLPHNFSPPPSPSRTAMGYTEMKDPSAENSELSQVHFCTRGVGQNIAFRGSPTAGNLAILISSSVSFILAPTPSKKKKTSIGNSESDF